MQADGPMDDVIDREAIDCPLHEDNVRQPRQRNQSGGPAPDRPSGLARTGCANNVHVRFDHVAGLSPFTYPIFLAASRAPFPLPA
jgi:hypothetical protein